jgi:energy-coupling factor transport system permease protein
VRLLPAYRPRPSPLHAARAGAGAGFCLALALTGVLYAHPLVLAAVIGAVTIAGVGAGVGAEVARAARLAIPFALLVTLVNPLVYQGGNTVLVRGGELLGRRFDVTLEALGAGALAGLRVAAIVIAVGGLLSAAIDPDDLLRLFRRVSYRSALTASLATRLVPVLANDASRMAEAARCRPRPPGRMAVARAALSGALDRAVDVAAALEVRGYAAGGRPRRARRPWSRHDLRVGGAAVGIAVAAVGGRVAGVGAVSEYPRFSLAFGPAELALVAALLCLAVVPFAGRAARLGVARDR